MSGLELKAGCALGGNVNMKLSVIFLLTPLSIQTTDRLFLSFFLIHSKYSIMGTQFIKFDQSQKILFYTYKFCQNVGGGRKGEHV